MRRHARRSSWLFRRRLLHGQLHWLRLLLLQWRQRWQLNGARAGLQEGAFGASQAS